MIEIKHYGKLIRNKEDLSDETIKNSAKGVIKNKQGRWQCIQCESSERADYYTYYSEPLHTEITYCRHCLQLGRMDTHNDVYITDTHQEISKAEYHLDFQLSEQQTYASENVIRAIQIHEKLLLCCHRSRKDRDDVCRHSICKTTRIQCSHNFAACRCGS